MSDVKIGPYILAGDPRGIRISREDIQTKNMLGMGNIGGGSPSALLTFELYQPTEETLTLGCARLHSPKKNQANYQGSVHDHIVLDVNITLNPETQGLNLTCNLESSHEQITARLAINLELPGEADPKWLIPGIFYNQNKPAGCEQIFPSYSEIRRDTKRFVSNHWNFRTDRTSLPAVFCTTYTMLSYIMIEERTAVSKNYPEGRGITSVGMSTEEGYPVICVAAPYIEDPVKFSFCHEDRTEAEQTYLKLKENEPLIVNCEIGVRPLKEDGVTWHELYRTLYEEKRRKTVPRPRLSGIEIQRLGVNGMLRWHMDDEHGILHESCAFDRRFGKRGSHYEADEMHVGWTSGVLPAYALLWHGRETKDGKSVNSAQTIIDKITGELAPCGSFWPVHTVDGVAAGFGPEENLAHSRTIAEAVLFLVRAFRLELESATLHPNWFWAIQSNLNFALSLQNEDGAFPAYWDIESGEPYQYEGCGGLMWIAAMAAFDHLDPTNKFHESIQKAGAHYRQFIDEDFLYGSQEDQPLVPTCDDCHIAMMSYMLLYECDRDYEWLELSRRAAELAFTFKMVYNIYFPTFSMLGQTGFQTVGGDITSVSQPSLSLRGLISFGEMKKLSALTGDPYYEQRAQEGRSFATQMIARTDGEYNARVGMGIGEVFHTDWLQPKGMVSSVGHVWTLAVVAIVELIEQTMVIPMAALQGDPTGVEEAMKFYEQNAYDSQIVMPASVDDIKRRSRDSVNTDVEEFRRVNETGIVRKPVTVVSQGTSSQVKYPSGAEDVGLPAGLGSIMGSAFEESKKQFARTPTESEQAKKQDSWSITPPNQTGTHESSSQLPKLPTFDTPKPKAPAQHKRPAPQSKADVRKPFGNKGNHTPLSDDENLMPNELMSEMLKPLMDEQKKMDERKSSLPSTGFDREEKNPDLGPPPDDLKSDLLSNLMGEEDTGPVINPQGSPDYEYDPSLAEKMKSGEYKALYDEESDKIEDEDQDDDDPEIKYKIF